MLTPIKTFYVGKVPSYEDFVEAVAIARQEDCMVVLCWSPSVWSGWYHEYVFSDSKPHELFEKQPKVYGI